MSSHKQRGKLFIIPASPSENEEEESFVFKLDLHRRQNLKKFLVLGNNKHRNGRKMSMQNTQFKKIRTEEKLSSISDVRNSSDIVEVFDNQLQKDKSSPESKLDFGYFSLSVSTKNLASLVSTNVACKETHRSDDNKSSSQDTSVNDSLETFCIKRKLWLESSSEKCRNSSLTKCDIIDCDDDENLPHKPSPIRRKNNNSNYTKKILELRKQFHNLVKQLKFCETDEDKCLIIIKIIFCFLKGSFSHLCNRIIPKIILMIKEMCRNQDSRLCCSIVIFALAKAELISNFSSVLTLAIALMRTDAMMPCDKQENNRRKKKIEKHLDLLKFISEKENLEIISQYTTTDFILSCILKFIASTKTDAYKSQLRCMGGLDIILDIVNSQTTAIWNEQLSSKFQLYNLSKLEHCLNILQNVIFKIPENQSYVLDHRNFQLLQNLISVLQFLQQKFLWETFDKVPAVEYSKCLSSALKVLINITYKNVQGSIHIETYNEIISIILFFLISVPYLKQETDVMLLCLGLLANLIMTSKNNLHKFTATKVKCLGFQNKVNAVVALSKLFQKLLLEVQKLEIHTEKLLYFNVVKNSFSAEDFEDNGSAVFHSAGHHMEYSTMCSFLALILGYAIEDNKENAYIIKKALPYIQFDVMATILKEFHDFVNLTDLLENVNLQEIQSIVDILFSL